jgi:hypothetical protein
MSVSDRHDLFERVSAFLRRDYRLLEAVMIRTVGAFLGLEWHVESERGQRLDDRSLRVDAVAAHGSTRIAIEVAVDIGSASHKPLAMAFLQAVRLRTYFDGVLVVCSDSITNRRVGADLASSLEVLSIAILLLTEDGIVTGGIPAEVLWRNGQRLNLPTLPEDE